MESWLPFLAVTTTIGRILLIVAGVGIIGSAAAMVTVHNANYEITAHRASLFAAGGMLLSLGALAAALLVSSGA